MEGVEGKLFPRGFGQRPRSFLLILILGKLSRQSDSPLLLPSESLFIVHMERSGVSQYRKGYFAKVTKLLVYWLARGDGE